MLRAHEGQEPLRSPDSSPSVAALGREQFGLELTAERLRPNGARLGQNLTYGSRTRRLVRAGLLLRLANSGAFTSVWVHNIMGLRVLHFRRAE